MRVFLLVAATMIAFAANSVLNRLALAGGAAGAADFAMLRLVAGAAMLFFLLLRRGGALSYYWPLTRARWMGVAALSLYMIGFSFAYISLDTGIGALILFGGVQITMFAGALGSGEAIAPRRWAGAGISFAGLAVLVWPGNAAAPDLGGAALMALGAVGWGIYSLLGRSASDPLAETAANFLWSVPVGLVLFALWPAGMDLYGALLAILAGAVTSGLGYALWYTVLPRIQASEAAIAQLTVPVIAALGGVILLGEVLTLRFVVSAVLVLGGILIALGAGSAQAGRK